jgi:hypothetical protein
MHTAGMDIVYTALGFTAFLALWWLAMWRLSGGRFLTPLWLGFSATALAVGLIGAGLSGYRVSKHARSVSGAWSDGVIWWEVWVGLAVALLASLMLTQGARRLSRRPQG